MLGQNVASLACGKCFMSKVNFDKNTVLPIEKFRSLLSVKWSNKGS